MARKPSAGACCRETSMVILNNCQVEALLTVDQRGQMVLPKELRERAGIRPGDKLGVVTLDKSGAFCCFLLLKADALAGQIKNIVGPIAASRPATAARKKAAARGGGHA